VWTFCGSGAGGEPEKVFKSLASKAARALPESHDIPVADCWKVWLDALRNENRNFEKHPVEVVLSPQECDRLDLRATKGVVKSVMIDDEMAAKSARLGFSTELGSKTQREFEGTAGVSRDLFATSANYCLELDSREHPRSRETLPDEPSAQAAKAPPAPGAQQSRVGKRVRSEVAIERVKQEIRRLHEANSHSSRSAKGLARHSGPGMQHGEASPGAKRSEIPSTNPM
jgi:hypothetical protein